MREMRGFLLWMAVILAHMVQVPMLWFVFWQVTDTAGGRWKEERPMCFGGSVRGVRGTSGCAFHDCFFFFVQGDQRCHGYAPQVRYLFLS